MHITSNFKTLLKYALFEFAIAMTIPTITHLVKCVHVLIKDFFELSSLKFRNEYNFLLEYNNINITDNNKYMQVRLFN